MRVHLIDSHGVDDWHSDNGYGVVVDSVREGCDCPGCRLVIV